MLSSLNLPRAWPSSTAAIIHQLLKLGRRRRGIVASGLVYSVQYEVKKLRINSLSLSLVPMCVYVCIYTHIFVVYMYEHIHPSIHPSIHAC